MLRSILLSVLMFSWVCCMSQGMAINTTGSAADSSAMLDVSGVSRGMLINRMTTTERNAILNPANSLLIYNVTTKCFEFYANSVWNTLNCSCSAPAAPGFLSNNPSDTQIEWNWASVAGAAGYMINTANDYASAVNIGNYTTYTQSGLSCNTSYILYVWAYNNCGHSSPLTLNEATSACNNCGTTTVTFTYNGSVVTYGTVTGQNGTCWLDRNLGAAQIATAYNHYDGYGDLFQWGRSDDGHQVRNCSTTTTLSTTDVPGHSDFILALSSPYDWRSGQNNNLWQGAAGINNPCPSGWRLPNEVELNNERFAWGINPDYYSAIGCSLKLPAAGYHCTSCTTIYAEGTQGYYWSSTVYSTYARSLIFFSNNAAIGSSDRGSGYSVRCIKD